MMLPLPVKVIPNRGGGSTLQWYSDEIEPQTDKRRYFCFETQGAGEVGQLIQKTGSVQELINLRHPN